jgi:hypothetical protein
MHAQHALLSATMGLAASPLASAASHKRQVACTSAAIPHPKIFGAEIVDIKVNESHNQTALSSFGGFPANLTVSYCGVNVCVTTDLSEDALADQQQLIHSSRMERYYQC